MKLFRDVRIFQALFGLAVVMVNAAPVLHAQDQPASTSGAATPPASQDATPAVATEWWNLFYQATSIGDYHGSFPAQYDGPFSLHNTPERDVSLRRSPAAEDSAA